MKNEKEEKKDKTQNEHPVRAFFKENAATLILVVVIFLVMGSNWLMNKLSDIQTWIVIAISIGLILLLIAVQAIIVAKKNIKKSYDDAAMKLTDISNDLDKKISNATGDIKAESGELSEIIKKLEEITAIEEKSKDLLKYVKDTEFLTGLEGSVGDTANDASNIYVQSSRFLLETTDNEFSEMICSNLQKGVVYHYLIPHYSNDDDHGAFVNMVHAWFADYSKFLCDAELCKSVYEKSRHEQFWDSQYKKLIDDAYNYFIRKSTGELFDTNNVELSALYKRAIKLFIARLKVSYAPEENFFITTAAYETHPGKWKAIIKLPTETTIQGNMAGTSRQKYYSFLVFGDIEVDSTNNFIKSFKATFKNKWDVHTYKNIIYAPLIHSLNYHKNISIDVEEII